MKWIKFHPRGGNVPNERRYVLVQLARTKHLPPVVCVGYLRRSGVWKMFVTPGVTQHTEDHGMYKERRKVTHWCDCLGDDFYAPMWKGKQI